MQAGVTLVGTLIGLLLSMLGLAAMLVMYQATVSVSTEAARSAQRDTQLVSGMLAAQMHLQAGGWRVETGTEGETVRIAPDGRQVLWRFRDVDGGPLLCEGLRLTGVDAAGTERPDAGLHLLPATPCTGVDDPGLTWSSPGQPVPLKLVSGVGFHVGEGEVSALRLANAAFQMRTATCVPFGQGVPVNEHALLTLEADGMRLFGVCLQNIHGATIPIDAVAPGGGT